MELFEPLRVFGLGAIALRLLGAITCGVLVGLDREMCNKKAGIKTHVLVCLGAALTMVVGECIVLGREGVTTDITRIASNVVTGVGFICAASLVTRRNGSRHGITTAAGLWTTSVIGLACGAGWVEVGLLGAGIVLLVFSVLGRLDTRIKRVSRGFELYVELRDYDDVSRLLELLHEGGASVVDLEVTKSSVGSTVVQLVAQTAHMGEKGPLIERFRELGCVYYLETL